MRVYPGNPLLERQQRADLGNAGMCPEDFDGAAHDQGVGVVEAAECSADEFR